MTQTGRGGRVLWAEAGGPTRASPSAASNELKSRIIRVSGWRLVGEGANLHYTTDGFPGHASMAYDEHIKMPTNSGP